MSSIKKSSFNQTGSTSNPKKDQSVTKNLTVLQKYLANNHTTEKDIERKSPKPAQSKLPISVQKKPLVAKNTLNKPSIPSGKSPVVSKSPAKSQARKLTSDANRKSTEKKLEKTSAPGNEENEQQPGNTFNHLYKSHEENKSSDEDDDEHLVNTNRLLERFRNSKPMPREKRSHLTKKNLENTSSSVEGGSSSDSECLSIFSKQLSESKELANLKERLNTLREKMFSHGAINQLEPVASSAHEIENNRQTRTKRSDESANRMFNIDSLDLKTNYLIEKSESTLMDKLNSSDGVGSSSQSSSITASLSSNYQEPESFKPEFLRYLENRSKPNHSPETGEKLKPEDDILYQWRLRRKMEEAKNSAHSLPVNSTIVQVPVKPVSKPRGSSEKMVTETQLVSQETFKNTKITIKESEKQTIETQTSIVVESIDQASLYKPRQKLNVKSITTDTNDWSMGKACEEEDADNSREVEITIENEEPTKDNSDSFDTTLLKKYKQTRRLKNESNQRPIKPKYPEVSVMKEETKATKVDAVPRKITSNFLASSPIREKPRKSSETTKSNNRGNNTSADLTKVSIIAENTPKPRQQQQQQEKEPKKSSSPVHFTHSSIKEPTNNKSRQFSVETINSSRLPSVISSVASTITNVTQQNNNNPEMVPNSLANFNRLSVSSIASNNTHTQIERNFRPNDYYEVDKINNESTRTTAQPETDLKESDEILRILFKKNYFYQLKLKEIDELITS